eukprot:1196054-Prorocentrum_minimum.AAC.1
MVVVYLKRSGSFPDPSSLLWRGVAGLLRSYALVSFIYLFTFATRLSVAGAAWSPSPASGPPIGYCRRQGPLARTAEAWRPCALQSAPSPANRPPLSFFGRNSVINIVAHTSSLI